MSRSFEVVLHSVYDDMAAFAEADETPGDRELAVVMPESVWVDLGRPGALSVQVSA